MRSLALAIVVTAMACSSFAQNVDAQQSVRRIIQNEILSLLPADGAGGIAVAVHIDGRLMFFDGGLRRSGRAAADNAQLAVQRRLTAQTVRGDACSRLAVQQGKMALDDPVSNYLPELSDGRRHPPRHGGSARNPYIGASAAARPSTVADNTLHAGELHQSPQGLESRSCPPARPPTSLHARRLHPAPARARARARRFHRRPRRAKALRAPRHEFQLDTQTRQGRPEQFAATAATARRPGLFRGRRRHRPSQGTSRPTTTGRVQVRCTAQYAILPSSWTPTWAKAASHRRSPERWPWRKRRHSSTGPHSAQALAWEIDNGTAAQP